MLFSHKTSRIKIDEGNILIDNKPRNIGTAIEINHVFDLSEKTPKIKVFEDRKLIRDFVIEPLNNNPDLQGQYLHGSIRILPNSAVMIDGVISKNANSFPKYDEAHYEGLRLQPFYLSNANAYNIQLRGKGLFERGLHFSGTITPSTVRNICICDDCQRSFAVQHFHAGFSEVQYFYSSDGKETLIIPYGSIKNLPVQLQKVINADELSDAESKLPLPSNGKGTFNYYNPLRCPYCFAAFIDFENHKEIRPNEYYGNTFINQKAMRPNP